MNGIFVCLLSALLVCVVLAQVHESSTIDGNCKDIHFSNVPKCNGDNGYCVSSTGSIPSDSPCSGIGTGDRVCSYSNASVSLSTYTSEFFQTIYENSQRQYELCINSNATNPDCCSSPCDSGTCGFCPVACTETTFGKVDYSTVANGKSFCFDLCSECSSDHPSGGDFSEEYCTSNCGRTGFPYACSSDDECCNPEDASSSTTTTSESESTSHTTIDGACADVHLTKTPRCNGNFGYCVDVEGSLPKDSLCSGLSKGDKACGSSNFAVVQLSVYTRAYFQNVYTAEMINYNNCIRSNLTNHECCTTPCTSGDCGLCPVKCSETTYDPLDYVTVAPGKLYCFDLCDACPSDKVPAGGSFSSEFCLEHCGESGFPYSCESSDDCCDSSVSSSSSTGTADDGSNGTGGSGGGDSASTLFSWFAFFC